MEKQAYIWLAVGTAFVFIFALATFAYLKAPAAQQKNAYSISAADAEKQLRRRTDVIILDIRTPEEFNQGHIDGAINIDYYAEDFKGQLALLDKEANYLLHCRSGARSGRSLPIFQSLGIKNIAHMDRGMNDWAAAGLPISRN